MDFSFLLSEQSFQKTLVVPVQDNKTARDKNVFGTKTSSNSESDQKFSEFLRQSKENSESQKNTHKKQTNETAKADDNNVDTNAFATQRTATYAATLSLNNIVSNGQTGEETSPDIVTLHSEIQALIDQHKSKQNESSLITIGEEIQGEDNKAETLLSLIASFFNDKNEEEADLTPQHIEQNSLASVLGKINDAIDSGDIPSLTSGLTLEQLTSLQKNLDAYIEGTLSQDDKNALEALASQWVTLTHPPKESASEKRVEIRLLETPKAQSATKQSQDISSERHHAQARYDMRYDGEKYQADAKTQPSTDSIDFDRLLKSESFKSGAQNASPTPNQPANTSQGISSGTILTPAILSTLNTPDQLSALGLNTHSNQAQFHNSLTSVVTQSQSATQPHPATQMVSATIQKAVKAGDDTNIKLRLDPPELGRIEVKMSIDKDSKARIVLTAEKPETFMMLQRDSDVLQRALDESGLDVNGEIDFELASEQHDFNREQEQGRQAKSSSGLSDDGENDLDVIETVMDWHVDPHSGHMRYNILV